MPEGKFKSRTYRRLSKRLPSGKTVLRYEKRAPGQRLCAICKSELKGIPRVRPVEMQNLPKSMKTVERRYGGNLCSKCSRLKIVNDSRKAN
jgi:large subunit ribosomal protein L34e